MSKPEEASATTIDEKPALTVTSGSDDSSSTGLANNASPPPPPGDHDAGPPNGGLVAWLQVAAAFVLYGNTLYVTLLTSRRVIPVLPSLECPADRFLLLSY